MKKITLTAVIAVLALTLVSCGDTGGGTRTISQNFIGRIGSWDVELWRDDRGLGAAVMNIYPDGTFSGSWTQGYNTLLRVGRKFPAGVRVNTHNDITVRYEVSEFWSSRGATYLTLYGWIREPLIEWYIIEDWMAWNPGMAQRGVPPQNYTHHGTVFVDGGTYDIISAMRVNQPSIDGTQTFMQIFNIRRERRRSGTVNVSAHFESWINAAGIDFRGTSSLYEVSFCIEGFGGPQRSDGRTVVDALRLQYGNRVICTGTFSTPTPNCSVCGRAQ